MFTAELNAKDQAAELRWQFKATLITRTIFDYQPFFFFFLRSPQVDDYGMWLGEFAHSEKEH